jgi:hypothetical protein
MAGYWERMWVTSELYISFTSDELEVMGVGKLFLLLCLYRKAFWNSETTKKVILGELVLQKTAWIFKPDAFSRD